MSMRFCPKCDQEVEASSGHCLLGHRLALDPPVASIGDLRKEVDDAFAEALEVAAVATGPAPAVRPRRVGPPPPPPPRRKLGSPSSVTQKPVAPPQVPGPTVDLGPGAVPTEEELLSHKASVWKDLDKEVDLVGDPIGAFAPPPSMDWGPSKGGGILKRKATRSLRRRSKDSDN